MASTLRDARPPQGIAVSDSLSEIVVDTRVDGDVDFEEAGSGLEAEGGGLLAVGVVVGVFGVAVEVLQDESGDVAVC